MTANLRLTGTGVALVTPFHKDSEQIDFPALEKLVRFCKYGGVEYLVALGTTAETPTLSKEEKMDLLAAVYDLAGEDLPVVVGIGGNDTRAIATDLETYPLGKAAAVLSASPYYNKPTQEGIYQHYHRLAEVSPKPLLLYNVPGRTGRNVRAETTVRLAETCPNIIGIKEASDNLEQIMQILRDKPEGFLVLSGDDALTLPQLACGIDGVISVAANAFPRRFSEMVRLGLSGRFFEARELHYRLLDAYSLMFEENNPGGVKGFLRSLGICGNEVRLPLVPASEELTQKIELFLKAYHQTTADTVNRLPI